jgi:hypothetical protein
MRNKMAEDIMKLSVEWKKAKEEARKKEGGTAANVVEVVESSDDEVDIVEHTPASGKGKGKGRGGGSAAKRGPAKRLR